MVDDPKHGDARKRGLLEAAMGVFMRYGFRKTSMDEVARAAQVSRQGLYLHFATKEELFRATVQYYLDTSLEAVRAALGGDDLGVEARLVGAFDAWVGRYVAAMGAGATDLAEVGSALVGPTIAEHEAMFTELVTKALRATGLAAVYKPAGLTARQLAETLHATARGLKHSCTTREAFLQGMTVAIRAMCLPLGKGHPSGKTS